MNVYDGPTNGHTQIMNYAGSSPPSPSSSGLDMFVNFDSDGSVTYAGFVGHYIKI